MMYKPKTLGEGSGQVTGLAVSLGNAMKIRCALVGIATSSTPTTTLAQRLKLATTGGSDVRHVGAALRT